MLFTNETTTATFRGKEVTVLESVYVGDNYIDIDFYVTFDKNEHLAVTPAGHTYLPLDGMTCGSLCAYLAMYEAPELLDLCSGVRPNAVLDLIGYIAQRADLSASSPASFIAA